MSKYKCPKCRNSRFDVYVTNTPIWTVDEDGEICEQHVFRPDETDVWECVNCGYKAKGYEFVIKED